MENQKTFTKENLIQLEQTALKIAGICNEQVDGELMMSQKKILGELITDFIESPIVKNSGLLKK